MNPGDTIGPYTISRELGRGGMGVVYLATDARLNRSVAIKALPPELAEDPNRLARFEREARTLAQLSHPNIAGLYGLEEQHGQKFLVLEHVEGQTLAEFLDRGVLGLDDALEIGVQVAAGVEAAHDASIVHRDLKPGNVIITPDGRAKVLDFGLARQDEVASSSGAMSHDPTLTSPAQHSPTNPGAILGTAAYMSPEQARGRNVDRRTDVWSFGVMLYEMLCGASPFVGETVSDSIGAILHKDVDLAKLPTNTPERIRHVLWRCLQRNRDARYRDIGDVRIELQSAIDHVEVPWSSARAIAEERQSRRIWLIGATAAATALIVGGVMWFIRPNVTLSVRPDAANLAVLLEPTQRLAPWSYPKLSPDGRRLILRSKVDETTAILVRDLDKGQARTLQDTARSGELGISPDGRWVFYAQDNLLKKMPIEGGPAITICEAPTMRGAVWISDGTIIVNPKRIGPLCRVSNSGGTPEPLYAISEDSGVSDRHPAALPGGQAVLFSRGGDGTSWDDMMLMVGRLDGSQPKELVRGAANGRYLHTGHLIYQRRDTLMAAAFDLDQLEITSAEVPVLRGLPVESAPASAPPQFDLSENGTLVFVPGESVSLDRTIMLVDLEGNRTNLVDRTGAFSKVVPSDDGQLLAIEIEETFNADYLGVLEVNRNLLRPVPDVDDGVPLSPVWSPDGLWIVFAAFRNGIGGALYQHRVGSAAIPKLAVEGEFLLLPCDWSSDGRSLLAVTGNADSEADLLTYDAQAETGSISAEPRTFIDWPGDQFRAKFSPDDRWVLFVSWRQQSEDQLFVASSDDPTQVVQVTVDSGNFGTWAPNRDTLYYVDDETRRKTIFAVDYEVSEDGRFTPSSPRPLFDLSGVDGIDSMHMTPDGKAFILALPASEIAEVTPRYPHVIINWAQTIEHLLPTPPAR